MGAGVSRPPRHQAYCILTRRERHASPPSAAGPRPGSAGPGRGRQAPVSTNT
jgi:hypothetical protein